MSTTVMPLGPDDPKWARKARVAELHDLWLKSGCNTTMFLLLLDYRHDTRPVEVTTQ